MNTICDKCGGKIKYNRVLKEETVRVEKSSGCCLISILLTICTCGLNLLFSYLTSFKKTNRCVIRGTCQKCGKVYEFDSSINEVDDIDKSCETCVFGDGYDSKTGWCNIIGDYKYDEDCYAYRREDD